MTDMRNVLAIICAGMVLAMAAWGHEAMAQRVAGGDAATAHRFHEMSSPTRIIRAWRKLELGAPVYTIDDLAESPGWLRAAEIQKISWQSGKWHIWIEPGYTVFRIYPYTRLQPPKDSPDAYECLVIKVRGDLSVADLRKAIRERVRTVLIHSFSLRGVDVNIFKPYAVKGNRGE